MDLVCAVITLLSLHIVDYTLSLFMHCYTQSSCCAAAYYRDCICVQATNFKGKTFTSCEAIGWLVMTQ